MTTFPGSAQSQGNPYLIQGEYFIHPLVTSGLIFALSPDKRPIGPRSSNLGPDHNEVDRILDATAGGPDRVDLVQFLLGTVHKLGIRHCTRSTCVEKRTLLSRIAPTTSVGSQWHHLRDWALVTVSCKASFDAAGEVKRGEEPFECTGDNEDANTDTKRCNNGFERTNAAVYFCTRILGDLGKYTAWLKRDRIDAFGLCELLLWISISNGKGRRSSPKIQTILKERQLSIPEVRNGILQLPQQSVCQSRLWKLADATEWSLCSLPSLLDALGRFQLSEDHRTKHQACNPQTCLLSDINATRIDQLHMCPDRHCEEIVCPGNKLNELENDKASGTWTWKSQRMPKHFLAFQLSTKSPKFVKITTNTRYIAISHVWSDGTGVGLKQPGHVNRCLFDFFSHYALKLDCDAVWWDTICVPTDKEQRQKALKRMHRNFYEAEHTLVHDKELASFVWKSDGSPCIALALSTWFTRGWTALELYASRSVKILFADETGDLVIKDLDDDILASEFDPFAHPAWIEVSAVIRRVRRGNFWIGTGRPISHILHILNNRYTCWSQDRMLIAGLMADMGMDSRTNRRSPSVATLIENSKSAFDQAENTKNILKRLEFITQSSLLHGKVTISHTGPWSWCPLSFFDLSLPTPSEIIVELQLEGKYEGCLRGTWYSTRLQEQDTSRLEPVHDHLSTLVRIQNALVAWKSHWLLAAWGPSMPIWRDRYLLVKYLGSRVVIGENTLQRCAYIGTLAVGKDTAIFERMEKQNLLLS